MPAVVTRNSLEGSTPPPPPVRPDGQLYAWAMFYDGNKRIAYADALADLIDVLRPGYTALPADKRLEARIRLAFDVQVVVQSRINAAMDVTAWNALTPEQQQVLTGPRHQQPDFGALDGFWEPNVPLVLVETGYAPHTVLDRPLSSFGDVEDPENIWWLRPIDEWDLLYSVHRTGFVSLHPAADQ